MKSYLLFCLCYFAAEMLARILFAVFGAMADKPNGSSAGTGFAAVLASIFFFIQLALDWLAIPVAIGYGIYVFR